LQKQSAQRYQIGGQIAEVQPTLGVYSTSQIEVVGLEKKHNNPIVGHRT